jgi:hypothetical protein
MNALLKAHTPKLLTAMPDVKSFENRLAQLNAWWGKITLIGKINSHNVAATILDDMNRTQSKFGELQQKLTHNLLYENVQKLVLDNSSKAQVAIDLLIRNLFERTADVGFLATDNDIRVFLAEQQPSQQQIDFIETRLQEYVKKYSVYDEIMVFDTKGQLKAHLDKSSPVKFSDDPLLAQTLASSDDYVETFRYTDLQPGRRHSLIYSCKITETDQKTSKSLGVLCLCFRFDDEIHGIFANLLNQEEKGILTILSVDGQVIASSDEQRVPLRAKFSANTPLRLNIYQGKDYITNTRETSGYQGFFGLGWYGQMMTPLNEAFSGKHAASQRSDFTDIMEQASSFPQELRNIRKASADINADLGLLVLNGQIASARKNAAEFMPVLEAIKQIGSDIASIFTASVNRLQEVTVMSSHLNNAGFLAALAADIMDRNLYERANDCRWWALTSAFRHNLAQPELSPADKRQISEILQYINALYTVYTNLYVYNVHGEILAVSDSKQTQWVGTTVDASTGALAALQNSNSQKYSVSPFVDTHLYQNRHTYIYNAAITDLTDPKKVLGGIGIVFDSEPQFSAMLEETLPRDENGQLLKHCFAVYTDRNKNLIAVANRADLKVGDKLTLEDRFFGLPNGQHSSDIIQYDNQSYVLGMAASKGYREYKTADGYQNDVLALVFIPF